MRFLLSHLSPQRWLCVPYSSSFASEAPLRRANETPGPESLTVYTAVNLNSEGNKQQLSLKPVETSTAVIPQTDKAERG